MTNDISLRSAGEVETKKLEIKAGSCAHFLGASSADSFPPFSSPEPTILLACGRNRELWEQSFQVQTTWDRITRIRLFPLLFQPGCSQSSRFRPQAKRIVGSGDENVADQDTHLGWLASVYACSIHSYKKGTSSANRNDRRVSPTGKIKELLFS